MSMRLAIAVFAVSVIFRTVSFADERDARTQAKALYQSGMAHYNLNEIREALKDFKEAYRLFPQEPVFLFNIAQCHRRLGDHTTGVSGINGPFNINAPGAGAVYTFGYQL
jgi:tetratricopeptide (TPR) repeat protein